MILTAGNLNTRERLAGDAAGKKIAKIGVGTDDTPVTPADAALTGAVINNVSGFVYLPGGIVQFQATMPSGDPTMTIKEIGLYDEDDVLVHRKVIAPYSRSTGVTTSLAYNIKIV